MTSIRQPPNSDPAEFWHLRSPLGKLGLEELTFDVEQTCPYLHDRVSRLPLRLQLLPVLGADFDDMLRAGNRRTGRYLYQTACPGCQECEPIRIPVSRFRASRSQRRVWKKTNPAVDVRVTEPIVDELRVRMFNAHRNQRGMNQSASAFDRHDYVEFLTDTCCDTIALDYYLDERLIAVAICDRGENAWSAVYTFFDPAFAAWSPGTFSILKQIELCQERDIDWLYLGFYIENCRHMRYKEAYRPHQRLVDGRWQDFP